MFEDATMASKPTSQLKLCSAVAACTSPVHCLACLLAMQCVCLRSLCSQALAFTHQVHLKPKSHMLDQAESEARHKAVDALHTDIQTLSDLMVQANYNNTHALPVLPLQAAPDRSFKQQVSCDT